MRALAIIAVAAEVALVIACIAIGVSLVQARSAVESLPTPGQYATLDVWHSEEPPAGEEIIGLWYTGYEARSHVVVMANGLYYPASIGRMSPIEIDPPVYWRRLP